MAAAIMKKLFNALLSRGKAPSGEITYNSIPFTTPAQPSADRCTSCNSLSPVSIPVGKAVLITLPISAIEKTAAEGCAGCAFLLKVVGPYTPPGYVEVAIRHGLALEMYWNTQSGSRHVDIFTEIGKAVYFVGCFWLVNAAQCCGCSLEPIIFAELYYCIQSQVLSMCRVHNAVTRSI
jgi:hypothetical protein